MRLAIVSQGAIASLMGAHFYQAKLMFSYIIKKSSKSETTTTATVNFINQQQLHLSYQTNQNTYSQIDDSSLDIVILPLKAFQIESAFISLQNKLKKNAIIILLHNGLGTHELISKRISHSQTLLVATTTHGAFKPNANTVQHTGTGETFFGSLVPLSKTQKDIVKTRILPLMEAFPTSQWDDNINERLWLKLAINACINPITAINQQQNNSVLNKAYSDIIKAVCAEVALCATQEGVHLTVNKLIETVEQVAKATAVNFSSMNRDIHANRPTEIDFITGYILNIARKHQLKTPMNQHFHQQITQLTKAPR